MSKVIVVKVGSSVIVNENGLLDYSRIASLVRDISQLMSSGYRIVLVTSGAIAAGKLNNTSLKGIKKEHQAAFFVSVGQPRLMRFYSDIAMQYNLVTAQVLVTREAFANRIQYLGIRDAIRGLLQNDVLPIVNDNDFLHKIDANFSDNDHLASYLGGMLNASSVVFLSSVDGILRNYSDPSNSSLLDKIESNFEEARKHITPDKKGMGGMGSKLTAAKLLFELGIDSYIGNGYNERPVTSILNGSVSYTKVCAPETKKLSGVRKWLCTGAVPKGEIIVSEQGSEVIKSRRNRGSLLAKGIVKVTGEFKKEDVVSVSTEAGYLLGYGITRQPSHEISAIKNNSSTVVVHADYFFGLPESFG